MPAGVVFCDLPQLPAGAASTFILTMFAAVAEPKHGLIMLQEAVDDLDAAGGGIQGAKEKVAAVAEQPRGG